jgi:hypothetical protein
MQARAQQTHTDQRLRLRELVGTLDTMELAPLQAVWRRIYGQRTFVRSRTYLRRLLAHRFQEIVAYGTSQQVRRGIKALAQPAPTSDADQTGSTGRDVPAPPVGAFRDPRLPPPGTMLRREHGGRLHEVVVGLSECVYGGARYRSLSAVAVKIYGGQVNGYAFFARALRDAQCARLAQGGAP